MARSTALPIIENAAVAPQPGQHETARYWRDTEMNGLELLRATFVTHAFPRHTHEDRFVVGVIERGVQACVTKGSQDYFPAGTVVLLNPSTVHTGRAFDGIGYSRGESGVALLDDALAHIEARVVARHEAGDHTVLIAQVEAAEPRDGRPLLYYRGGYAQLER